MVRVIFPFNSTFLDYLDTESHALLVFMAGCENNCEGCQNPLLASYDYEDNTVKVNSFELQTLIQKACIKHKTNKVILTGGDPLASRNVKTVKELLALNTEIDYMIYTGHEVDYVKRINLSGFKFIKCGKYMLKYKQTSEKNDNYFRLASTNQGFYNESLKLLSVKGTYYFEGDSYV